MYHHTPMTHHLSDLFARKFTVWIQQSKLPDVCEVPSNDLPSSTVETFKDSFLDQIIVNEHLQDEEGLSIVKESAYILDLPKYRQQEGNYKHYPYRFWAGNRLLGGYSDHLAIKVEIIHK